MDTQKMFKEQWLDSVFCANAKAVTIKRWTHLGTLGDTVSDSQAMILRLWSRRREIESHLGLHTLGRVCFGFSPYSSVPSLRINKYIQKGERQIRFALQLPVSKDQTRNPFWSPYTLTPPLAPNKTSFFLKHGLHHPSSHLASGVV